MRRALAAELQVVDRLNRMTDGEAFIFSPLTASLIEAIEPWFDDVRTQRFLGGRDWIRTVLPLLESQPGSIYRGVRVTSRHAWVVSTHDGSPVGFLDVETYDDGRADFSIVVDPAERGRGVGAQILQALQAGPDLATVTRFTTAVAQDNPEAQAMLRRAGFTVGAELNEYGELKVERRLDGRAV